MKLEDILNESCFGTIATIKGEECLRKLEMFLEYNKPFINRFPKAIASLNCVEGLSLDIYKEYQAIWSRNIPNVLFLGSPSNRGHMFGTIELEEAILKYVKENYRALKYIWKTMDDVLLSEKMFDLEVKPAGFYYIPGFSYESIIKADGKDNLYSIYENFESGFWTPQTTFFIADISNFTNLYGNDIDNKYRTYVELKKANPEIKPWEIAFDIKFDCETHLGRTTKNVTKFCLIRDKFKDLLNFVETHHVGDPSHKNIFFNDLGLCHYHFYTDVVYNI